jgi:threonine aldolase
MWFSSDNAGPAHPAVMAALMRANEGHAASYGADEAMERVRARIREVFEAPEAAVFLVATGTAANALTLACLCPPWGSVFCHEYSHVAEDECGAPEFYTGGAKLMLVPGADCKMDAGVLGAMVAKAAGSVHNVQRGAVSLTNATEAGTVYAPDEVAAIAAVARAHGMPVHLDGARFANALVSLGCSPAEMTWKAGVDAVSFGGTKNGLLGVEAVVLFDPALAWEFELRRKRGAISFRNIGFCRRRWRRIWPTGCGSRWRGRRMRGRGGWRGGSRRGGAAAASLRGERGLRELAPGGAPAGARGGGALLPVVVRRSAGAGSGGAGGCAGLGEDGVQLGDGGGGHRPVRRHRGRGGRRGAGLKAVAGRDPAHARAMHIACTTRMLSILVGNSPSGCEAVPRGRMTERVGCVARDEIATINESTGSG